MVSLLQIFYDPAAVFAKVKERGSWAVPLLVTALLTMISAFYVTHTIGMENITRRVFDQHPSMLGQLSPDQKEKAIQLSATPARLVMGSCFAGAGVPLTMLIVAAILLGMLAIMDRKPGFSRILGVVAWSMFPITVITCAMSVLILFLSPEPSELDPQTLLATNFAAFLDKNSVGPFLFSLARSFDLLAIGQVCLLSFGLSKVAGPKMGQSMALVFGLWLVWILLRGGFAAATGF